MSNPDHYPPSPVYGSIRRQFRNAPNPTHTTFTIEVTITGAAPAEQHTNLLDSMLACIQDDTWLTVHVTEQQSSTVTWDNEPF